MNLKNVSISLVAVGLLVMGGLAINKDQVVTQPVGAISSPDLNSQYFSFGGVRQWAGRTDSLTAATTTVCAIQSPAGTSTLVSFSLRLDVSSTTASTVTVARAATAYATTSAIETVSVGANAQALVIASTTVQKDLRTFGPSTWLVGSMAGGTGSFSPSGSCRAVFQEV